MTRRVLYKEIECCGDNCPYYSEYSGDYEEGILCHHQQKDLNLYYNNGVYSVVVDKNGIEVSSRIVFDYSFANYLMFINCPLPLYDDCNEYKSFLKETEELMKNKKEFGEIKL